MQLQRVAVRWAQAGRCLASGPSGGRVRFVIAVLDDRSDSATSDEMAAIDAFNQRLHDDGHWILAGGLAAPASATVVDNRGGRGALTHGPFVATSEYVSGFWLVAVPDADDALRLAAEGSRCCNRRVEVREFLGGGV